MNPHSFTDSNISAVVIVKNGEQTIEKCLCSLQKQEYLREIIVVDGNSTDRTREIVKRFPVKLVTAPLEDTYGISRNLGVNCAEGEIILFLDADDFVESNWSKFLRGHFENERNGIVIPKKINLTDHYQKSWFMRLYVNRKGSPNMNSKPPEKIQPISWREVIIKGSAAIRKKAILEVNGFVENMFFGGEDSDLAYRLSQRGYMMLYDPRVTVFCKPTSSVWEYLNHSFLRTGMVAGYFRRIHGFYRPSIIGMLGIILPIVLVFSVITTSVLLLALSSLLLSVIVFRFITEIRITQYRDLILVPAYIFVRIMSRILAFIGFTLIYLLDIDILYRIRNSLSKLR